MSFPRQRQELLDPVLNDLSGIPGVVCVEPDDFDSTSINVFLTLDVERHTGFRLRRPDVFVAPLRSTKAGVKHVCKEHGVSFNFLDWPVKQYQYWDKRNPKVPDGYQHGYIKIEVFV